MFFEMEGALAVGGDNTRGISFQHHRKSLYMFITISAIQGYALETFSYH